MMCRYETILIHSLTLVLTIVSQICINIDVIVITVKCTYRPCDLDLWHFNLQNHVTTRISQGHSYTKFGRIGIIRFLSYAVNKQRQTDRQTDRRTDSRTDKQADGSECPSHADRQSPSHWLYDYVYTCPNSIYTCVSLKSKTTRLFSTLALSITFLRSSRHSVSP